MVYHNKMSTDVHYAMIVALLVQTDVIVGLFNIALTSYGVRLQSMFRAFTLSVSSRQYNLWNVKDVKWTFLSILILLQRSTMQASVKARKIELF